MWPLVVAALLLTGCASGGCGWTWECFAAGLGAGAAASAPSLQNSSNELNALNRARMTAPVPSYQPPIQDVQVNTPPSYRFGPNSK